MSTSEGWAQRYGVKHIVLVVLLVLYSVLGALVFVALEVRWVTVAMRGLL